MSGAAFPQGPMFMDSPVVDPQTGVLTRAWAQWFLAIWQRTGSQQGGSITVIQEQVIQNTAAVVALQSRVAQLGADADQQTVLEAFDAAGGVDHGVAPWVWALAIEGGS